MRSQLDFDIIDKAPVIFGVAKTTFNLTRLKNYYDAVIQTASAHDQWILYEHPLSAAVIVNLDAEEIREQYQRLANNGCVGVAYLISPSAHRMLISPNEENHPGLKFKASANRIVLSHFVEALASQIEASSSASNQFGEASSFN
jgi:hypothetical protein